jgi:hypothetical protein
MVEGRSNERLYGSLRALQTRTFVRSWSIVRTEFGRGLTAAAYFNWSRQV